MTFVSYNKNLITTSRSQRINISNLAPSSVYVPVELRCWDMCNAKIQFLQSRHISILKKWPDRACYLFPTELKLCKKNKPSQPSILFERNHIANDTNLAGTYIN